MIGPRIILKRRRRRIERCWHACRVLGGRVRGRGKGFLRFGECGDGSLGLRFRRGLP